MRMDIEISPGARVHHSKVPARDNRGPAAGEQAGDDGRMTGKRVCSASHSAPQRWERRFIKERMKGLLWRHSKLQPRGAAERRTVRGMDSPAETGDRS
jgi:hypothetical protein